VSRLVYIGLDAKLAGAEQPVALDDDPDALARRTWDEFLALIAAYRDPARGYPARARPRNADPDGDYDHLSRLGEWRDGDPVADDAADWGGPER
jgi:RecB family exonuclease